MMNNVTAYCEKTACRFPDKVAIKDKMGELSFSTLIEAGKIVATKLLELQITGKPVAVYMPKCKEAVVSFWGINYSGNYYVPLDIKSPLLRTKYILDVLEPAVILTDIVTYNLVKSFVGCHVLVYEDIVAEGRINEQALELTQERVIDTDPVYCIFTSGSTGIPKGVLISHRGVMDYIDWAVGTFAINVSTLIGNQAPFFFDNSTLDIYLMYATGATLDLIPEDMFIFPIQLIDYLNEHRISFIFWVPSVLINVASRNVFTSVLPMYLDHVLFAGEVMPNKHLNYWRNYLPDCRYVNLYGPTEITVDCTWYDVKRSFSDDEPLPIGFPCRNTNVLILNEKDLPAKDGETGELCVRGSSLALGYYNEWEKTHSAFVQNPLNPHYPEFIYRTGDLVYRNDRQEIVFVGRKDSQIKHNGYRIELGEIETAAMGAQLLKRCSAAYDLKNRQIVLFYEAAAMLLLSDFRKHMLIRVPKYMVPTILIKVDKMPLNANGKIDRAFLNQWMESL